MRKHLLFLLYFITSLSCYGYDFEVDGIFYNILSNKYKTCEVTYGVSTLPNYGGTASFYEGDIVIPEKVSVGDEIYEVIAIGEQAFYCCNKVTNIEIPSTILRVKNASFVCCTGLKSFSFPEGVEYVSDGVFDGCTSLESVHFSSTISRICTDALFCYCTSLRSITVSDKNKIYKSVDNCILSKDGKTLFRGCRTSVIPDGVECIGAEAFDGCQTLETINIPSSVKTIGRYAFWRCTGLNSISLPECLSGINYGAFCGCTRLENLKVPNSVSYIESNAFEDLLNIEYEGSADGANWGALYLNKYSDNHIVYEDKNKKKLLRGSKSLSGDVVVPDGVQIIEDEAFKDCHSMTSVVIPSSVTSIGKEIFYNCHSLTSVYVNWDSPMPIEWDTFWGITACTLYVPQGTKENYRLSDWHFKFTDIVEYDATGIGQVKNGGEVKDVSRHSVDGKRLDAPAKGLNIVKYSDGSVRKIAVQ